MTERIQVILPPGKWDHIDKQAAETVAGRMLANFSNEIRWFVQGQRHNHQLGITEVSNTEHAAPGLYVNYQVLNGKEQVTIKLYPTPEMLEKKDEENFHLLIFYRKNSIAAISMKELENWVNSDGESDLKIEYQKDLEESDWNAPPPSYSYAQERDDYFYYSKLAMSSMRLSSDTQVAMMSIMFEELEGDNAGKYKVLPSSRYWCCNLKKSLFTGVNTLSTFSVLADRYNIGPDAPTNADKVHPSLGYWAVTYPAFNGSGNDVYLNGDYIDFSRKTLECERVGEYPTSYSRTAADGKLYGGSLYQHIASTYIQLPNIQVFPHIFETNVCSYAGAEANYNAYLTQAPSGYTDSGFFDENPSPIDSRSRIQTWDTFKSKAHFTDDLSAFSDFNHLWTKSYTYSSPSHAENWEQYLDASVAANYALSVHYLEGDTDTIDVVLLSGVLTTSGSYYSYFHASPLVNTVTVSGNESFSLNNISYTSTSQMATYNNYTVRTLNFPPAPEERIIFYEKKVYGPKSGPAKVTFKFHQPFGDPTELPDFASVSYDVTYEPFGSSFGANGKVAVRSMYLTETSEGFYRPIRMYVWANTEKTYMDLAAKLEELLEISAGEIDGLLAGVKLSDIKLLA